MTKIYDEAFEKYKLTDRKIQEIEENLNDMTTVNS
jgi:hypothetical protein